MKYFVFLRKHYFESFHCLLLFNVVTALLFTRVHCYLRYYIVLLYSYLHFYLKFKANFIGEVRCMGLVVGFGENRSLIICKSGNPSRSVKAEIPSDRKSDNLMKNLFASKV